MDYQFQVPTSFSSETSGTEETKAPVEKNKFDWSAAIPSLAGLAGGVLGLFGKNNPQAVPTTTVITEEKKAKNTKLIIGLSVGFLVLIIALYFISKAKK